MKVPEQFRVKTGPFASDSSYGNNGLFSIQHETYILKVIASDGEGWEHVSVSLPRRTPSWNQMCFIKDLFWDKDECVVQYHPAETEYINNHEYCLHLWKPIHQEIPVPPSILVGYKTI
jgi:hypothetical protein